MTPNPPFFDFGAPRVPLPQQLRDLADLLEADPAECPDAVKTEMVLSAVAVSGRLDAAVARAVSVFDANTIWAGDGARSCGGWLTARTELSGPRARGIVATARDLRACPYVDAAWSVGLIGTDKARALLRARSVHPDLFATHEAGLVAEIAPLTVARATVRLARWTAIAEATRDAETAEAAGDDPDDTIEDDPTVVNEAHLSQSIDGIWFGTSTLDAVTGAERHAAVTARIDAKYAAGIYRHDDGMSFNQRYAACEHELVLAGADPTQTKNGQPRPSVSVHLDARTLAGIPVADLNDALARRCELDNGTPIARTTAERLLCTCRLTAIATKLALDGTIEITAITDLVRDATPKQRRALRERDGGCIFTGCNAPFDWCDAHHLWQHETGGPTLLANLVLLCRHHHHLVHEGGWHLWRDRTDGRLYLRRPDGTPVPIVPHGTKIPTEHPPPHQPPPPPRRNGPPRFLTRRELAELEYRRQQRRRQRPD